HLLKYDSVLGNLKANVSSGEVNVKVDGKSIKVFKEKDPAKIDWPSMDVSVVVESTGLFTNAEDARKHLRGPVKKVIISAPRKGDRPCIAGTQRKAGWCCDPCSNSRCFACGSHCKNRKTSFHAVGERGTENRGQWSAEGNPPILR